MQEEKRKIGYELRHECRWFLVVLSKMSLCHIHGQLLFHREGILHLHETATSLPVAPGIVDCTDCAREPWGPGSRLQSPINIRGFKSSSSVKNMSRYRAIRARASARPRAGRTGLRPSSFTNIFLPGLFHCFTRLWSIGTSRCQSRERTCEGNESPSPERTRQLYGRKPSAVRLGRVPDCAESDTWNCKFTFAIYLNIPMPDLERLCRIFLKRRLTRGSRFALIQTRLFHCFRRRVPICGSRE